MVTRAPRRKKFSPSTPMPSITLDLGKYVTTRPRDDGTFRVYFQVPKRLRPSDWPSIIPLPREGERTGDLANLDEVKAIQEDARALYKQLNGVRIGRERVERKNFDTLIRRYQRSDGYLACKRKTQRGYDTAIKDVKRWVAACVDGAGRPREPDPCTIVRADVEGFLQLFNEVRDPASGEIVRPALPTTKRQARKVLRLLMETAISLNWRKDNPCDGLRLKGVKTKVGIWEQEDVDLYVKIALEDHGHGPMRSIAAVILTEWEIGQRVTDAREFRPGTDYDRHQGVFRFFQSKTNSYVTIPVSAQLRALLDEIAGNDLYLFRSERTGKAYTEESLGKAFAWIRKHAIAAGGRYLKLAWLRHSCVVQLARHGCTVPEICAITGHTPQGATKILATYLPRDNEVAWNAQRKRGLIADV